jgi:hypothetical protein
MKKENFTEQENMGMAAVIQVPCQFQKYFIQHFEVE